MIEKRALLEKISKRGDAVEPVSWNVLKTQIKMHLEDIVEQCDPSGTVKSQNGYYQRAIGLIDKHSHPPFTLQRLCELLLSSPVDSINSSARQYARLDDYLLAICKILQVESFCTDPSIIGKQ